jgi:hypothetical protein
LWRAALAILISGLLFQACQFSTDTSYREDSRLRILWLGTAAARCSDHSLLAKTSNYVILDNGNLYFPRLASGFFRNIALFNWVLLLFHSLSLAKLAF